MLEVYQSPIEYKRKKSVFLAGSITNAADWQSEFIKIAQERGLDAVIFNPRRKVYDENCEAEQIKWEYDHFKLADAYVFYFSHETVAPITLFELGAHMKDDKLIFLYVDKNYPRKNDVYYQLDLAGVTSDVLYAENLEQLVDYVRFYLCRN